MNAQFHTADRRQYARLDNRTLAADMLGISRSSLWRKLREYGV